MPQNGITLLLINLDNSTTVQVGVSVENGPVSSNTKLDTRNETVVREEYHLTAKDGDLHSRTMLLNGEILQLNSSGQIPPLEPRRVDPSQPISVAPYSILFTQIPIHLPACT